VKALIPEEKILLDRYMSLSKNSYELYKKAQRLIPDGITRRGMFFPPYPVYIVRGEGCRIFDADGREYLDYTSNLGPLILGHKHPKVLEKIMEQLKCGTVLGGPTELEIRMAEKILEAYPSGEQVLFCASGTEANMVGFRSIRAYTGKDKILKFEGAFHGTSDFFIEGKGVPIVIQENTINVPFNDIEKFQSAIKRYRNELAAVFVEPVMRGIPPNPEFLAQVRKITEENGVLLVFDEVVTGYRLCRGGAQEKWRVKADMTLLGKIVGGGMPIGVVVTSNELLGSFRAQKISGLEEDPPFISHAGTYNAHPITLRAGLSTLEELTPNVFRHLEEMGTNLRNGMEKVSEKVGIVTQIVGVGSIFNVYFTDKPVIDASSAKRANRFLQRVYDLNMIVRGIYPAKMHCSFISVPITNKEVEQTLAAMEDTLFDMKPIIQRIQPELLC
jgi:glutamate-1-semialdehyde 2,1-aminomutase